MQTTIKPMGMKSFGICDQCNSREIMVKKNDNDLFWTDICKECGYRRKRINLP